MRSLLPGRFTNIPKSGVEPGGHLHRNARSQSARISLTSSSTDNSPGGASTAPCTCASIASASSNPESLQFVASPLLTFAPVEPGDPDSEWEAGRDYPLKLYLLGFIPLGRHTIRLVKVDRDQKRILSRESGLLARVWNHEISFREIKPGLVSYSDEIEIRAGYLTPVIWLFAHGFYRHRQRRWKVLLRAGRSDEAGPLNR